MKIDIGFPRKDNPEEYDRIYRRIYAREYYKAHRKKCIKYRKEYREGHKEYYEEYRREHRSYYSEYNKKYSRKHNKTVKGRLSKKYHSYKHIDKHNNYPDTVDYTFKEFLYRVAIERCFYCSSVDNLGLDRIDNDKGHSKVNTNVACSRCNKLRSDNFTVEEFKLIGKVLQQIDRNRIAD